MNFLDALRNSAKVIKEGLITPNKFNRQAADRFKGSALPMLGVPGAIADTADQVYKGNPGMAVLAATGAVPGIGALGMFIGKGAKNGMWNVFAAEEAARLLRKGIDPHMTTGVHQGADDILRQEIPDNLAQFYPGALENLPNVDDMPVGKLINYPELFKAYPEIADMSVASMRGSNSMYHPEWDSIGLGRDSLDPMSSMLHEIQHKIQQIEGWAKGGSPTSFQDVPGGITAKDQYRRLAGEVEARATQNRQTLTRQGRRSVHPYRDMDHDIPDQVVWGVGEELPGTVQKEIVDKLIRTLRARGYDHAKLQDRPYGYGTGGAPEMDETAYTLFPGAKTK